LLTYIEVITIYQFFYAFLLNVSIYYSPILKHHFILFFDGVLLECFLLDSLALLFIIKICYFSYIFLLRLRQLYLNFIFEFYVLKRFVLFSLFNLFGRKGGKIMYWFLYSF